MTRPVCLRVLAFVPVALASLAGTSARAEQSEPARQTKQADPKQPTSATPPPTQIALRPDTKTPITKQPPDSVLQETPAQRKYGLPRNPTVGGPVDTDLNKPLSLERAVRIGLLQQNSIAIAKSQADAASARLTQSRSTYYPQITPSLTYNTALRPGGTFTIGGQTFGGAANSETRTDVIAARQLIFDTGKREANVGQSRRSWFAAEYNVGNQRQNVILNVITAYYDVLRNQELVRVQQESVRRAQAALEQVKAQVEAMTAAKTDTLQFEADLANAQVALILAQNNANIAQTTLKNAMGVVSAAQPILEADRVAPPDTKPDMTGLEQYVKEAYDNRLDIKQQIEQINAQGYAVKLAHINNGITVQADITEGYQLKPDAGEERQFNVSISYPLFDGGNTRAAVRESKAQLEQDRRTLDQLQQNVRLNVEQSYLTREQARQRVLAGQVAVTASQSAYDVAREKLKVGAGINIDVLNAQGQLVTAQVNLVQAIYDFYIADAALQRDIGLNDPEYVPNVPGLKKRGVTRTPMTAQKSTSPVALNTPAVPASEGMNLPDAGGRKP